MIVVVNGDEMKPKPGGDGKYPVDKASAVSGDKLLRTIMADNKLELYGTYVCSFFFFFTFMILVLTH